MLFLSGHHRRPSWGPCPAPGALPAGVLGVLAALTAHTGLRPLTLPRPPPPVTPRRRPAPHPVPPAARASRLACSSPAASLAPAASVSGAAAGSGVAHGPAARSGLALGPGAATLPWTLPEARNLGPDPLGRDGLLPGVAERLACTPKARASWDTHARREHTHRRSRKCGGFRKWTARPSLPLAATSPAPEAATSIVISGLGFSEVIFRSRSHASKPIFGVFKLTHLLLTSAGGGALSSLVWAPIPHPTPPPGAAGPRPRGLLSGPGTLGCPLTLKTSRAAL